MARYEGSEDNEKPGGVAALMEELHRLRRRAEELERVQATLRESEERFRLFYEHSPLGYQSLDADGLLLEVNPTWLKTLGYGRDEAVGRWFGDFLTPESQVAFPQRFAHLREVGEVRGVRFDMVCKDGRVICVEFDSRASNATDGSFDRAHCVMRDITDRSRIEEALQKSEARFRAVFDNAPALVAVADTAGRWVHVNQHAVDILGYSRAELAAMRSVDLTHPEDGEQTRTMLRQLARGEIGPYRIVKRYIRKDGRIVWADLSVSPIHNEKGRVEAVIEVALDITATREAQEEIKRSRLFLQTVLDAFPGNVAVLDGQGRIVTVNNRWLEFGRAEGLAEDYPFIGTNCLEVCRSAQGEDRHTALQAADGIEAVLLGRESQFSLEYPCHTPARQRWFRLQVSPFLYEDKRWAVVAHIDVTRQKHAILALQDSERKFRAIADYTYDLELWVGVDGRPIWLNPAVERFTGWSVDECLAMADFPAPLLHADDRPTMLALYRQACAGSSGNDVQYRLVHINGAVTWISASWQPIHGIDGTCLGWRSSHRDITDRVRTEEQLRASQRKLATIFDGTPVIMLVVDADRRVCNANRAALEATGYSAGQIEGLRGGNALRCLHALDDPAGCGFGPFCAECTIHRVVVETLETGNGRRNLEARLSVTAGERADERIFQISTAGVDAATGRLALICLEDITDRKRAEKELQLTADLLRAIKDAQALYITGADPRQVYQTLLQALVTMTGSEYGFLDEVLTDEAGRPYKRNLAISDISWDEPSRRLYGQLSESDFEFHDLANLAGAAVLTGKLVIANRPRKDARSRGTPQGHPPIQAFMGLPMYFGGQVIGVAGVANRPGGYDPQIAEFLDPFVATCAGIIHAVRESRKEEQYRQALRESEATARALLNAPGLSALLIDREGGILGTNRTLADLLGRSEGELIGQSIWALCPPPIAKAGRAVMDKVLHSRQALRHEEENQGRWSDTVVYPIVGPTGDVQRVAILARDITEQKQAQKQAEQRHAELLHVSRLSTLGEMASGFAHELNQPLSAIMSFAGASLRSVQSGEIDRDRLIRNVEQIVAQSARAGEIIRRVRAFAQRRPTSLGYVDLNEAIHDVLGLLGSDLHHKEIEVALELAEDLPAVVADVIQLEQVLLNLMRNAIEAMDAGGQPRRRLTLCTRNDPKDAVTVLVSDTGPGIRPKTTARVFDSFFTTKENGLGIGLSISRSIIESHRGQLWVDPGPGRGCTFAFTLPAAPPGSPSDPLETGTG